MNKTILFLIAVLLPLFGYSQPITIYNPQDLYEEPGGMFDINSVRTLSIDFYNPDYHEILVDNWMKDNGERLPAKIHFENEIQLDSVATRYKGNSTFSITNSFHIRKLPLNLDMNEIVKGQKLMGYKKLKLANSMFDPTFSKEITGYSIYRRYLPSPQANYMKVELNGEYLGLYINTEAVNKQFLKKHFNEDDGVLFKCDPIQRYGLSGPSGKSNLQWLGSDSALYYNHYTLKSDAGWKEFIHMIDVLNNDPDKLDSVLNIDRVLWAFAVNQVIANFDTYNGIDPRNYYMYQTEDGLFQMIPWDVSESFINAMLGDLKKPENLYQYDPYHGSRSNNRPLITLLTSNPSSKYGKIYTAHLRTVLEESLDYDDILEYINQVQAIAEEAVTNDPHLFWGMKLFRSNVHSDFEAFGNSFAGIMNTINKRKSFLMQHPEIRKKPPVISAVNIYKDDDLYYLNVNATNVKSVELMITFNEYNSKFKSFEMTDNGLNGDIMAGDNIFSAPIPQKANGTDTRFYIRASNNNAISLSPERAEYEFYIFSPDSNTTPSDIDDISLYPNPNGGILYVKGNFTGTVPYQIISSVGSVIQTGYLVATENMIDLTTLPTGIYFIRIENKTYKIIKSK